MHAFLSIKYHPDQANRTLITTISSALEQHGFATICVCRDIEQWGAIHFQADELMHKTFAAIDRCSLVVVDLSEKGVGLGIEAGYAYARGKPIITIACRNADISMTLRGISTHIFTYDDPSDLSTLFAQLSA